MRKISMLAMTIAAVAIAAPAMAQSYGYDRYGGYSDRTYDQRGGWNRDNGRDMQRNLIQLNRQVQNDLQTGVISRRVAKAFFNRIQELQRADARARDKNGGWLRPDQARDMQVAVARMHDDLRSNENQYGQGYGYGRYDQRRW
jgi:hypothetical protein